MSLAEELLADLEDYGDDELEQMMAAAGSSGGAAPAGGAAGMGLGGAFGEQQQRLMDAIDEIDEVSETNMETGDTYERVHQVARLRNSENFERIMAKIRESESADDEDYMGNGTLAAGPLEATDPEYRLIVEANNVAVEIDNEINVIHKFIRDKYAKRFPELESLVPTPLEYISCVRELGNDILEKAKNSEQLQKILMPATVIVVSVTASTTQGEKLTDEELEVVEEACEMAEEVNEAKVQIYRFVERRMTLVAPNVSAIVGAATAAKLMGVAGGLSQLSKMPACNVLVLGAQKNTLSGFSSTAILPNTGFVYYTQLVQTLPPDLRKKAARLVAAKCTLAARVDAERESRDGQIGRRFGDEIASKFDKWQEPPPVKQVKALPKPLDAPSKKRGGRRIRKMKERLGLTEMRRKANRMTFGDIQEDVLQDNMGFTLGQMKSGGQSVAGGRVRAAQVDQKSRVRMSKTLQRNLAKQNAAAGGSTAASAGHGGSTSVSSRKTVGGTVSTVTFTPVQGLEISNPQAQEKKAAEANAKYFGSSSGFFKIQTPLPGGGASSSIKTK